MRRATATLESAAGVTAAGVEVGVVRLAAATLVSMAGAAAVVGGGVWGERAAAEVGVGGVGAGMGVKGWRRTATLGGVAGAAVIVAVGFREEGSTF